MSLVGDWRTALPEYEQRLHRRLRQTLPRSKRRLTQTQSVSHPGEEERKTPLPRCVPYLLPNLAVAPSKLKKTHLCPFPLPPLDSLELVDVQTWADVVGLHGPLVKRVKGARPFAADPASYWMALRSHVRARIRSVFASALESSDVSDDDVKRWTDIVIDMWHRVHSAPDRYREPNYTIKFSVDWCVIVVLYDMRNDHGLVVPLLDDPTWFGKAECYEKVHLCRKTTIIPHDPLVKLNMPEKGSLSRVFSAVVVEETTRRTAEVSQSKAVARHKTSKTSSASPHFTWNNKSFTLSTRCLRWCLAQQTHIQYHTGVRYEETVL